MRIGIVVYSQTGNTLSAAEALKEQLAKKGHSAAIEKIAVLGEATPGSKEIKFGKLPDLASYEALVLAAPVQAFSLCTAMSAYLKELPGLNGRKVACFVTKALPGNWTGGKGALATMAKAVEAKGGKVCGSGIVHWNRKEKEMPELVEKFGCLF